MALIPVVMLAVVLVLAAAWDIKTHRIPNWLSLSGVLLGLAHHAWQGGGPGLLYALAGVSVAGLALLPYAVRGLGAGDVKLLGAVGAWMGPQFLLWAMLGTILSGGLLALGWLAVGGARRTISRGDKMPIAPAIALGALFAYARLHGGLLR